MTDHVRDEVVARIVNASDAAQRELQEVIDMYEPTPAEARAVALVLGQRAVESLDEAGVIRRDNRTVLDVNQRRLMALAAAYETARRWWTPNDNAKPLGDLLKVMPTEHAEHVVWVLRWGGLLPDDPEIQGG